MAGPNTCSRGKLIKIHTHAHTHMCAHMHTRVHTHTAFPSSSIQVIWLSGVWKMVISLMTWKETRSEVGGGNPVGANADGTGKDRV